MQLGRPFLKALDRMSCGGLLLDASGAVLDMNTAAEMLLRREVQDSMGALPTQRCSGAMAAGSATAPAVIGATQGDWSRKALKLLLGRAGSRFRIDSEAWITVTRRSSAPLVLHAMPLAERIESGPHTILVMVDLRDRPRPSGAVLQKLFDLTPAEARVAIEIGSGRTLGEVALKTGVSNGTLRTQLSSIFNKTQTRRQSELVALLARVAILP